MPPSPALPEVELKVRVRGRHPWFYRKMVRRPATPIAAGAAVFVRDAAGAAVGTGFYNPRTELALRMLARGDAAIDPQQLLAQRLQQAWRLRAQVLGLPAHTDAYRVVHAEGDGFPGLVIDRLGDALVAQLSTLCMAERIEAIGEQLLRLAPGARLVLTADRDAVRREGFEPPPRPRPFTTELHEHGVTFVARPGHGHKTGFFADQRDTRQLVRRLAAGRRVLDLCCHAGGFALHAAAGGAKDVLAVDLDEEAVAQARTNAERNRARIAVEHADAFDVLRGLRTGERDLLVLDPPKWVDGKAGLEAGLPRYLDLNRLALERSAPGALVVTCSCSGAVSPDRFEATVRRAAAEAGRDARILFHGGAGPDHPVALECPETAYLKVLVLQVGGC